MTIGYPKNKDSIDSLIGELAVSINRNFRRGSQLKTELDAYTDQQLVNAGYTAGEVAVLRSMMTAIDQMRSIYVGNATLPTATDFRPSLRPLWGVLGDY